MARRENMIHALLVGLKIWVLLNMAFVAVMLTRRTRRWHSRRETPAPKSLPDDGL